MAHSSISSPDWCVWGGQWKQEAGREISASASEQGVEGGDSIAFLLAAASHCGFLASRVSHSRKPRLPHLATLIHLPLVSSLLLPGMSVLLGQVQRLILFMAFSNFKIVSSGHCQLLHAITQNSNLFLLWK